MRLRARIASALIVLVACAHGAGMGSGSARDADDLLVVDCLLPGVVRQLGRKVTYVTARRPVKTSAIDCQIRGGEYTVPGTGDGHGSALSAWLPSAKLGDPEAQNYVGEIYERGLGDAPDYELAAIWYRRAAEQDYGPAQVNLGGLYQRGQGVPQNSTRAREWYRRASGLTGHGLAYVSAGRDRTEVDALQKKLAKRESVLRKLEGELAQTRRELETAKSAPDTGIKQDLAELRSELARAEQALGESRSTDAEHQREVARLQGELDQTRNELDDSKSNPDPDLEKDLATLSSKLAQAEQALVESQTADRNRQGEVERLRVELAGAQDALVESTQLLPERAQQIAALRAETLRLQQELTESQRPPDPASLPGPTIHIIEPDVGPQTRGVKIVAVEAGEDGRLVIGRIEAAAGIHRVLVNQKQRAVTREGLFEARIPSIAKDSPVQIVAIDKAGRRAERAFVLRSEVSAEKREAGYELLDGPRLPAIEFGAYHALVIGNDAYEHLPKLSTAVNDARAVGRLLSRQYGFQVTELIDATRYQVLSALNDLRSRLTSKDNLLIYYAGHGELDDVNQRGHWLPVDAERTSSANWISNVAITDVLNAMKARHVIVVSDSCYSGSLTRSALARLDTGLTDKERIAWQTAMAGKTSRTALTSGGLAPVMDAGGGKHSVFARVFLEVLDLNEGVLEGQRLYQEIAARVTYQAKRHRFEQLPQYAPIKFSGHESGDFFFVPRS